jgi:hypothetical protein
MFPNRNIHKFTWTSSDGTTNNKIDHTFIDRKGHSSVHDVPSFRVADCDTDHSLVVAKVREISAVSKQTTQNFNMERLEIRRSRG